MGPAVGYGWTSPVVTRSTDLRKPGTTQSLLRAQALG